MNDRVKLDDSWKTPLADEFDSDHMATLREFLLQQKAAGKQIFPKSEEYFRALDLTPLDQVRVVILELESDLGLSRPAHGFLEHWAKQGVLLLNSVLTVEMANAASHRGKGWEQFTDAIVRVIAAKPEPVVFMLWGSYAQKKAAFVKSIEQGGRHLVLKAPHPSPLSAYNGFFGCRHFSKANAFLKQNGLPPIDWGLPPVISGNG